MKRRNFIFLTVGAIGAALIPISRPDRIIKGILAYSQEEKTVNEIHQRLSLLKIKKTAISKFIHDYKKEHLNKIPEVNDQVMIQLLLSTDYVQNGADSSREIEYAVYYSPWKSPCYNPFMILANKNNTANN